MQDDPPVAGRDLCLVYQSGIAGFPSGGSVAVHLSGAQGPGLLIRRDLLHHLGGDGELQPAK